MEYPVEINRADIVDIFLDTVKCFPNQFKQFIKINATLHTITLLCKFLTVEGWQRNSTTTQRNKFIIVGFQASPKCEGVYIFWKCKSSGFRLTAYRLLWKRISFNLPSS